MTTQGVWKGRSTEFHEGRVNFQTKKPMSETHLKTLLPDYKILRFQLLIKEQNLYHVEVELTDKQDTISLCHELEKSKDIVWAEPDFVTRTADLNPPAPVYPDDPDLDQQWHIERVGAPLAWSLPGGQGDPNVTIAVLDSGIQLTSDDIDADLSHPDLMSDRIVLEHNYNSYPPPPPPNPPTPIPPHNVNDKCGHGTHVTGILGATTDNAVGVAGINWDSPIHIYKVLELNPASGMCEGSPSAFALGVNSALNHALAARENVVINYSAGTPDASAAMELACRHINDFNQNNLGKSQAILCAASGNGDLSGLAVTPPLYPANYALQFPGSVVCVGSIDKTDTVSDFSNYGPAVTVVAPGRDILSTIIGSSYGTMTGTSMATPIVTGIVSLIWSNNKALSAAQVVQTLKDRAVVVGPVAVPDPHWGYGMVSALWNDSYFPVRLSIQEGQLPGSEDLLHVERIN
jgi:subtilisin family serine protease